MKIGVVSDIHCQHEALAAALKLMGSIDRLLCLGDAIDQTRFCNTTVAMLRAHEADAIRGNHEEAFFSGQGRHSPSVDAGLADWLATRPASLEIAHGRHRLLSVHSTPWESGHAYVPPSDPQLSRFASGRFDVVLYGHTHQPVIRRIGRTLVVNPGSVGEGRPAETGFIRSCAVIDFSELAAQIIDLD